MNYIVFVYISNDAIADVLMCTKSRDKAIRLLNKVIKKYSKLEYEFEERSTARNGNTILHYESDSSEDIWMECWIEEHETGTMSSNSKRWINV